LLLQNVYVEDLNSTNGVLLNGKKITKRQLENNDVIHIGKHELKFIDEQKNSFDNTIILSADEVKQATTETVKKKYQVKVISGPNKNTVIELTRAYTTLGKPGGQVAVIAKRGETYCLMQMGGSPTGNTHPILNGEPLKATSAPLHDGDKLEVGGEKLCFMQVE
ncbi:MAG: FHA domain-containing protein, partial [Gammaproteobacteria bacterium]|nr:FHA domain-containing protein [Gammaproteobacteria bacterium]